MAKIKIKDLPSEKKITKKEMKMISGGAELKIEGTGFMAVNTQDITYSAMKFYNPGFDMVKY